jgi:hypothetical protein
MENYKGTEKIRLSYLVQTCGACPSQWEGVTENLNPVYIRYRWGNLTMQIGKIKYKTLEKAIRDPDLVNNAMNHDCEYIEVSIGDELAGLMNTKEMLYWLGLELKEVKFGRTYKKGI